MVREEFNVGTETTVETDIDAGGNVRENGRNLGSRKKGNFGFSVLCVGMWLALIFVIVLLCIGFIVTYENQGQVVAKVDLFLDELPAEQAVWFETNLAELRNAFRVEENKRRARNVVLFIALESSADPQVRTKPIWESFPHLALLRPTQGPGSPAFNPTSMFAGIETFSNTVGFDASIAPWNDCLSTENLIGHRAASIVDWAQAVGRRTGVITNGEIVDNFPAALYAHTPNGSWMYASPDPLRCFDVRSQLLEGDTGRYLNVIAGSLNCPAEFCQESFQQDWERQKIMDGSSYHVSTNVDDMLGSLNDRDYALGLYDQRTLAEVNVLGDITLGALNVLESPEGFLLVVHADPNVRVPSQEIDAAVRKTLQKLREVLDDSLIIVVRSEASSGQQSSFATVHATGPMAHLLHRVHNQTFLAHFVSYAARIGRFRDADLTNLLLQIF